MQILSPKNSFAKTSSALFRHLPEYLEGRTPKEKHPFLFQKKFHPHQIKNARSVFLSGLPRLCEAVAERYERTRQFGATTRFARAISRHQGCFQNTFELCTMNTASSIFYRQTLRPCFSMVFRNEILQKSSTQTRFEPKSLKNFISNLDKL